MMPMKLGSGLKHNQWKFGESDEHCKKAGKISAFPS